MYVCVCVFQNIIVFSKWNKAHCNHEGTLFMKKQWSQVLLHCRERISLGDYQGRLTDIKYPNFNRNGYLGSGTRGLLKGGFQECRQGEWLLHP